MYTDVHVSHFGEITVKCANIQLSLEYGLRDMIYFSHLYTFQLKCEYILVNSEVTVPPLQFGGGKNPLKEERT